MSLRTVTKAGAVPGTRCRSSTHPQDLHANRLIDRPAVVDGHDVHGFASGVKAVIAMMAGARREAVIAP